MLSLNINGRQVLVKSDPATPLLWVLRCELGMTGTKFGCGIGVCGACTVHVDGTAQVACQAVISSLGSHKVTTIEGLEGAEAVALRAAWSSIDVVQCGYCQSAQLMAASALLKQKPKPSDQDINDAMANVVCSCGTYPRIRAAIHEAARQKAG